MISFKFFYFNQKFYNLAPKGNITENVGGNLSSLHTRHMHRPTVAACPLRQCEMSLIFSLVVQYRMGFTLYYYAQNTVLT